MVLREPNMVGKNGNGNDRGNNVEMMSKFTRYVRCTYICKKVYNRKFKTLYFKRGHYTRFSIFCRSKKVPYLKNGNLLCNM